MEGPVETDRILLEGMRFVGYHGTRPEERTLGQPFIVDIDLRCDLRAAGLSDDLLQTVDYSAVYRQARAIVEGVPVSLTEAVAERIAAAVLAEHSLVQAVRVKVTKPNVRLEDAFLVGSAVEIIRRREP
jgi:dihydroneopterin aldolase